MPETRTHDWTVVFDLSRQMRQMRQMRQVRQGVRRFLSLGPDDEQAVTKGGGEVVHLMKADGVITAVKAISAAYAQFMTDHYPKVTSSESINRQTLELAGYVVEEDQSVCKHCLRMFLRGNKHPSGRRHCCDKYASGARNRLIAVAGYSLERDAGEICEDSAEL
jgi:hypothetical protein